MFVKIALGKYRCGSIERINIYADNSVEFVPGEAGLGEVDVVGFFELDEGVEAISYDKDGWHVKGREITEEQYELEMRKQRFLAMLESLPATELGWMDKWYQDSLVQEPSVPVS